MKMQGTQIKVNVFEKEVQIWRISIPDFKTDYKFTVTERVSYLHED